MFPSLEEVAVCAGHKVFIEVDDNILLIVGDLWGICDPQLWSHIIHLLTIIIVLINNINFHTTELIIIHKIYLFEICL